MHSTKIAMTARRTASAPRRLKAARAEEEEEEEEEEEASDSAQAESAWH